MTINNNIYSFLWDSMNNEILFVQKNVYES